MGIADKLFKPDKSKKLKQKKPSTSEQKKLNTDEQKKQYQEFSNLFNEVSDYSKKFNKYVRTNTNVSLTDNEITSGKKLSCALALVSMNFKENHYKDNCNYNEQIEMLKGAFDEFKQALSKEIKEKIEPKP